MFEPSDPPSPDDPYNKLVKN